MREGIGTGHKRRLSTRTDQPAALGRALADRPDDRKAPVSAISFRLPVAFPREIRIGIFFQKRGEHTVAFRLMRNPVRWRCIFVEGRFR